MGGLLIGFGFVHWISGISDSDELFSTLSCFVASLISFAVLTVFIISRSFEIISFVFGFLFGVCVSVIRYGFSNLERLELPKIRMTLVRRTINAIRDWRSRQKSSAGQHALAREAAPLRCAEQVRRELLARPFTAGGNYGTRSEGPQARTNHNT